MEEQKLRLLHYPKIASEPFVIEVDDVEEACKYVKVFKRYEFYQFKQKLKPVVTSIMMLEQYNEKEGEWESWTDEDCGIDDINEYIEYLESDVSTPYLERDFNGEEID